MDLPKVNTLNLGIGMTHGLMMISISYHMGSLGIER
jgi:hypothetical protein